jgi:Sec-independent protein secretion pathway component TatC
MKKLFGVVLVLISVVLFAAGLTLVFNQLVPYLSELAKSNNAHQWGRVTGSLLVTAALLFLGFSIGQAGLRRFSHKA